MEHTDDVSKLLGWKLRDFADHVVVHSEDWKQDFKTVTKQCWCNTMSNGARKPFMSRASLSEQYFNNYCNSNCSAIFSGFFGNCRSYSLISLQWSFKLHTTCIYEGWRHFIDIIIITIIIIIIFIIILKVCWITWCTLSS